MAVWNMLDVNGSNDKPQDLDHIPPKDYFYGPVFLEPRKILN